MHNNCILSFASDYFQAICECGWTSTFGNFEEIDLLRAMHAHAVKTFVKYQVE